MGPQRDGGAQLMGGLCDLRAFKASTLRSQKFSVRSVLLGQNFVARREDFFVATCHKRLATPGNFGCGLAALG